MREAVPAGGVGGRAPSRGSQKPPPQQARQPRRSAEAPAGCRGRSGLLPSPIGLPDARKRRGGLNWVELSFAPTSERGRPATRRRTHPWTVPHARTPSLHRSSSHPNRCARQGEFCCGTLSARHALGRVSPRFAETEASPLDNQKIIAGLPPARRAYRGRNPTVPLRGTRLGQSPRCRLLLRGAGGPQVIRPRGPSHQCGHYRSQLLVGPISAVPCRSAFLASRGSRSCFAPIKGASRRGFTALAMTAPVKGGEASSTPATDATMVEAPGTAPGCYPLSTRTELRPSSKGAT